LRRFGTPEGAQVLVGVLSAISTGTDGAQRVANTEIWVERSLDATTNIQAEARLDRMGARKQVQRFLVQDDEGYAAGRLGRELERGQDIRHSTTTRAACGPVRWGSVGGSITLRGCVLLTMLDTGEGLWTTPQSEKCSPFPKKHSRPVPSGTKRWGA